MNDYTNESALQALHYLCKVRKALQDAKMGEDESKRITHAYEELHKQVEALYIERIRSEFPPKV